MATLLSVLFTLVGAAIVWFAARPLRQDATSFVIGLAVVTMTWSAVQPGGSPVSDLLLGVGLVCAFPQVLRRSHSVRLPVATVVGAVLVAVSVFLNTVLVSDQGYAQNRYRVVTVVPTEAGRTALNVLSGVKLLIALLVIPTLLLIAATDRRRLRALLDLWVLSAVTSAFVAVTDAAHLFNVHGKLLGISVSDQGRQGGLSNHPVHLATVCVMALPILLTWLLEPGRRRTAGLLALAVLSLGVFFTGSRTGILSALVALLVGGLLLEGVRRLALPVAIPVVLFLAGYLLLNDSLLVAFLHKARLSGGSTSGSDFQRLHVAEQAVRDIKHRPLIGIGYDVAAEGHSVYLQALATGGVLGAAGLVTAVLGGLSRLRTRVVGRVDVLGLALGTSVLMWLLVDVTENALVDRYMYLPVAFLIALRATRARQQDDGDLEGDPTLLPAPSARVAEAIPVRSDRRAASLR